MKVKGRYYYQRRVPKHLRAYDNRTFIKVALKTDSEQEAKRRAQVYNEHIESYWKSLIKKDDTDKELHKYKSAVLLARSYGFAYKTSYELATAPTEELIERLTQSKIEKENETALLGGLDQPQLKLSQCEEQYWKLTKDRLVDKTPHKISKWKNPRKSSLDNFIEVAGDKALQEVSRTDILSFKEWWRNKIAIGRSPSTANKQLQMLKDILKTVAIYNEIDISVEALFAETKFRQQVRSRPPFEAKYVQDTLLPALNGLNERDRLVVHAIADTGARESELFGLLPKDIFLETDIPFIWIRPRKMYPLKTATSERQIPLVGAALYAFQQSPNGFQHKGNPDVFSTIVNKYLTENDLRPTPKHSIYSLRHTFKDRLRDIEAPEELIDSLMGHKKKGPTYGRGHTLNAKHKFLSKIMYKLQYT